MLITLTTDFGTRDPYVGVMKGVIAMIAPAARVIDITHELPPQDVHGAALMMESLLDYFPATTIHVAVVDPTVGSARAAIAVKTDRFIFIGPDNGLFTAALLREPRRAAVRLTSEQYRLHPTSATFHGRDVFAPAAAHLARGVTLSELGEPIEEMVTLDLPQPQLDDDVVAANVIYIDRFGNLVTNVTRDVFATLLGDAPRVAIRIGDTQIDGVARTYADVSPGTPVAYFGSGGRLEIAVRNGSAAEVLRVRRGDGVLLGRGDAEPFRPRA